jgi:hypothetical protein
VVPSGKRKGRKGTDGGAAVTDAAEGRSRREDAMKAA